MSKIYFTLTGTKHHHGTRFLEKNSKVHLVKEPENEYDREAIRVEIDGLGLIGYVANSAYTVLGDSFSAGRLYDKIGYTAEAKVKLITDHGVICKLNKSSILKKKEHAKDKTDD